MSTNQKISTLVEQQFPHFVRDDGPNFVAFVKAYYEWTEQANNVIEVSKNLREYQDLDTTYDKYLEYFHREVMGSIPRATLADRKKLAKHIKDMYRARGSELSYRLLFRLLYNEEIEFYYPGEDILRASDGRWVVNSTVRVGVPRSGLVTEFANQIIVGQVSGATAKVDTIIGGLSGGAVVDELYLLDINGVFQDSERITLQSNSSIYATIFTQEGPLQDILVTKGGAFHQTGDTVTFSSSSGSGAVGTVTATTDASAVQWSIANGGSGYTTGATINITHPGGGADAAFVIDSINNTEVISVNTDTIGPIANAVLNTGPKFISLGANTAAVSANLALANTSTPLNAALNFNNTTVGTINGITTSDFGYGYSSGVPTATVTQENIADMNLSDGSGGTKGTNALITAQNVAGSIVDVNITTFGINYNKLNEITVANGTRSGTQDAKGVAITSGVTTYPGKYIDTKGWLSWNNKVQDNLYYQEFSYELKSNQFTDTYRKLVNDIVHPGGTKMFGRIRLQANVSPVLATVEASEEDFKFTVIMEVQTSLPEAVSDSVESYIETAANTLPTIERLSLVEPTLGSVETQMVTFSRGTGDIFVFSNTTITPFATAQVQTYANVAINVLGTPRLVVGNNTVFSAQIPAGNTIIKIVDTHGATANGLYYTDTVFANTVMTIHAPYAGSTLSNGAFYIGTVV